MIRKLQRKFILIATVILALVTALLIAAVNVVQIRRAESESDDLLEYVASGMGREFRFEDQKERPALNEDGPPPLPEGEAREKNKDFRFLHITPETSYTTRYFVARFDADGAVTQVRTDNIAAVEEAEATEYAQKVIASGKTSGYADTYKYLVRADENGGSVWFLDCSDSLRTRSFTLWSSVIIGAAFVGVCVVLIALLSRRAVRPVIENAERQKRFITDAGHELKTPLAIISANTDVLTMTEGENEWLASTRNQLTRMEKLVQDLLTLARMEESAAPVSAEFDLSAAVIDTAEPFTSLALARGKTLELDVEPQIRYTGDEGQLRRLVSILLDNALKYASAEAPIRLTLRRENKKILLTETNRCETPLDKKELSRLFDRFYRADPSRARESGGFGIGLSIARGIVEGHKGKIVARAEDADTVSFVATL